MYVYSSIILDKNGIIRQVKTSFLPILASSLVGRNNRIIYASLYSFSRYAAGMFINAFSSFRFEEDDAEACNEAHAQLQQIILTGSHFANKSRSSQQDDYAELVFCFAGGDFYYEQEIFETLRVFSDFTSDHCDGQYWRIFSSRKQDTGNSLLYIAISLEKIAASSPVKIQLDHL